MTESSRPKPRLQRILPALLATLLCCHATLAPASHHEHDASMLDGLLGGFVPTHTAVASGAWSNPATWAGGQVPGEDAEVLVASGINVTYSGIGNARLDRVVVDGSLRFAHDASSRIVLDTLIVSSTGTLQIGTTAQPVQPSAKVDIVIADRGDINVANDPSLTSRGVVSEGTVRIHGAKRTSHLKLAVDALAGDTVLQLAYPPHNWEPGDTIVLTGTRYSGWKWDNAILAVRYHGTQDEVLTITSINGSSVTVDRPLAWNHRTPRADLKASVANFTRNVTISTENADTVPVHRRGHVMFMTADVDVRYAAFHQLGRTNKEVPSFEVATISPVLPTSNIRGRYPYHFHNNGVTDAQDQSITIGNAVFGSPGWGYVHHNSNANFHDNASFDTFGAGFVAETGNEVGSWTRNIAIRAEGNSAFNPKNGNDPEAFDIGRTGDGFWFQGRMVRSVDNIAASVNHGFVYLHRGTGMLSFPGSIFMLPEALRRNGNASPDDAPILNFHGNESFASTVGLYVVKANPNQQHDIHTHMSNFTAWEVQAGAALEYTSHYLLEDFDVIGLTPESFRQPFFGIDFGTNTTDMVVNRARVTGFEVGIGLGKNFTAPAPPPEANQYVVIDAEFSSVNVEYESLDNTIDQILVGTDLVPNRFEIVINNGQPLEYLSPATTAGSGVSYLGTKTDSIGPAPIPAGTDAIGTPSYDMIAILEQDGYYRTASGTPYAVVEEYFTERATGEIHKFGLKTFLGPNVESRLGDTFTAWGNAFLRGVIDLQSLPPVASDDQYVTSFETARTMALLSNDSDPDGDPLGIDGIVQPNHGVVTDNGNGTATYQPDFGFTGVDSFYYWATDNQGNFSRARVLISVGGDQIFGDGFDP
ncbi:Ig-like domain-containing protein [Dokdonella sp.]|uniref:Ig-like domain-containing protein n=1 Tax=Dokdonella sp. TaxID=2291710 RepID=UPI003C32AE85